ncbi:MAG: hypothetical protein Q8Q14_00765 [Gemmatimonadales bacterium]|nr:hypothetical protein [Gemmatimonadales bacterium]
MSTYGSDNVAAVLVNGYDWLSYVQNVRWKKAAVLTDATVLGDPWRKNADSTVRESELSFEGFYDDAVTSAIDARAIADFGVANVVTLMADGNTLGLYFEGFRGPLEESYERMIDLGDLHKVGVQYSGSQEVESGRIVKALAAVTADGNSDASDIDGLAASADGCTGYLQLTAITLDTATNLIVTLRDSSDAASWAAITGGAFTARTAIGAQRIAVAAAADTPKQYISCGWTWTGGAGAGSTATFMAGLHRIGTAQQ